MFNISSIVLQERIDCCDEATPHCCPPSLEQQFALNKCYAFGEKKRCKGITVCRYGSKRQQVLTLPGQPHDVTLEPHPMLLLNRNMLADAHMKPVRFDVSVDVGHCPC